MRVAASEGRGRARAMTTFALLALLLLAPRAFRLLHPQLWAEDEQFAMAAELLRQGAEPYRDFVHVNPPVLEWGLAAWFAAFGTSLGACEVLTAIVVLWTGALLFAIARPLGTKAALLAAGWHATAALGLRYHVFERETFVAFLVVLAWWLAPRARWRLEPRTAGLVAALLLAALVKLTALGAIAALFGWAAWCMPHARRRVLATCAVTAGGVALAFGALAWRYGEPFLLQNFVFPLVKGTNVPDAAARITELRTFLEPVFVLALPALLVLPFGRIPATLGLAALSLLVEIGGTWAFKPALWAHNLIPALPAACLLAASLLAAAPRWNARRLAFAGALMLPLVWTWWHDARVSTPGEARPSAARERVLVHGVGGLPRADWRALAEVAASRVAPGEPVLATSDWMPLVLGARPLLAFWETEPLWLELRTAVAQGRLWSYVAEQRGKSFAQRQAETFPLAVERVLAARAAGRLRWVISLDAAPLGRASGLPVEDVDVPGAFHLERLRAP